MAIPRPFSLADTPFSFTDNPSTITFRDPYYRMNIEPELLLMEFQRRFPPYSGVSIRQSLYSFEAIVRSGGDSGRLLNLRVPFNSVDAIAYGTPTAVELVDSILMSISRFDQRALENLYLLSRPSLSRLQCSVITESLRNLNGIETGVVVSYLGFGTRLGTGVMEYVVSTQDYSQELWRDEMTFSEGTGVTLLDAGIHILNRLNQLTRNTNSLDAAHRSRSLVDRLIDVSGGRTARRENAQRFFENRREREFTERMNEQAVETMSLLNEAVPPRTAGFFQNSTSTFTLQSSATTQASMAAQALYPGTTSDFGNSAWIKGTPVTPGPEFKEDYIDRLLAVIIPRLTLTTTARLDGTELSITTRLFAKMSKTQEPVEIDFIDDVVDLEGLRDE